MSNGSYQRGLVDLLCTKLLTKLALSEEHVDSKEEKKKWERMHGEQLRSHCAWTEEVTVE